MIGDSSITISMALSNQSMLMMFVVSLISFLVHLYSLGYMAGETDVRRYFAMLGFFTFAMQGIVLADSLLLLFVFWELVGFSSYLLIGHYTSDIESGRAAKKAFIMNRIGDVGFMVGLMVVWASHRSFELSLLLQTSDVSTSTQTLASLLIFCGVVGKSAQFPLFTWLPDAMKGPTPVSALIHAATMVAAGVYLLARIFPLFTQDALVVVAIVGAITAVIAAVAALAQTDIKKILAYSTVSQLGLMVLALGMGIVNGALLHLFTHAFFKACLFLCAGSIIHSLHHAQHGIKDSFDPQDIRNMGGLLKKLPVTSIALIVSGASLAGIPFFSGFLSKEAILTAVWIHNNAFSWIMFAVIVGVSMLTVVYTFRLIWFVVFAQSKTSVVPMEVPAVMRFPVLLLAACSFWIIVSWNPFDFTGWMVPVGEITPTWWITIITIVYITGALAFSWFYFRRTRPNAREIFKNAFFIDQGYQKIGQHFLPASAEIATKIDKRLIDRSIHGLMYVHVTLAHIIGWVDVYVVDGFVRLIATVSQWIGAIGRSFQGGKVQQYIFWAIFAIIIFLICTLN